MPKVTQLLNGKAELELASPQGWPLSKGLSLVAGGLVLLNS